MKRLTLLIALVFTGFTVKPQTYKKGAVNVIDGGSYSAKSRQYINPTDTFDFIKSFNTKVYERYL